LDAQLWIELGVFLTLLALSGFFSSSETAFFSLSRVQLEQMRKKKTGIFPLIEKLISQPRRLIITILIGNELVNVAASVLCASIIIRFELNKWLNLFVMVPILLLVGEITPKTLAIRNNRAVAIRNAKWIDLFAQLIGPLRWVIRVISDFFITMMVGKERSQGNIITEDMVRTLTNEAVGEGDIDLLEAEFIEHIFDFGDLQLEDIQTARIKILSLDIKMPIKDMLKVITKKRHSKIPIFRDNPDDIIGILHVRDMLGLNLDAPDTRERFIDLLRKPYFVPDSKEAVELFHKFREDKISIAMTVDEYGGITGLVTMEDLLECIFGELRSPSDLDHNEYILGKTDKGFILSASMPLFELNERYSWDLPDDEFDTIGGTLLHEHGELPLEKTIIQIGEKQFQVLKVENNRIVEILYHSEPDNPISDAEGGGE